MRNLWRIAVSRVHLPFIDKAEDTLKRFTASGRALFLFFAALAVCSSAALLYMLQAELVVPAPARGGQLTEGIIGSPRFINPVLAISDADRDLTMLVYSGLLRATGSGTYAPDLAESYQVSPDGKTYTFVIRQGATFHDGTPVTAHDVAFTAQKTQDPALKSPIRATWDGVGVAALDDRTVQFTLKSAYAPFIKNATLGILPKHLWEGVSDEEFPFSELNTEPVGTGPYKVGKTARSQGGIPASYTLWPFAAYALGEPYLTLTLRFYQSEEELETALGAGDIEAASGLTPGALEKLPQGEIRRAPLNRVFGVFFNQNQSEVLRDHAVRAALSQAVDRADLVAQVLGGYGTPLTGPVPPALLPSGTTMQAQAPADRAAAARAALIASGWVDQGGVLTKTTGKGASAKTVTLAFDISTANVPELRVAAEYLRETWRAVGAQVSVKVFEAGDLSQNVIRTRKYDALLFGEVIGRELDLFAFWHSSQRNDPGLNIALYTNAAADSALTSLRQSAEPSARAGYLSAFLAELQKDVPAVFLYAPDFVYSMPKDIEGLDLGFIETPSDRFASVPQWHRETDYVWPIFNRTN